MMDQIGVFTPEQARLLWQDYQERQQLPSQQRQYYPQRPQINEVSPHRVFVRNDSGETIPAYGCMQVTGTAVVGGQTVVTVDKPSTTDGEYLFCSQFSISAGGNGWAYRYGVVIMLGDPPSAAGVQYLPIVASWEIEEGSGPFLVYGDHNIDPRGLIGRIGGSGTGGGNTIWFTIDEVLCPDGYEITEKTLVVTPTWYTGGCDAAIPEQDPYTGTVNVYDLCSYLDYHVDAELPGTVGRATYMYPRTGDCTPRWILDDLCHQPECA